MPNKLCQSDNFRVSMMREPHDDSLKPLESDVFSKVRQEHVKYKYVCVDFIRCVSQ